MTKAIVVAAILTATAVSGCATQTGPQTINDFPRFQALELGKTTKQQVYDAFGQPQDVVRSEQNGQTLWRYFQVTARINASSLIPYVGLVTGGKDMDFTKADFAFASDGRLLTTTREQGAKYLNQWVEMANALAPNSLAASVEIEMKAQRLHFDDKAARKAAKWANAIK